MHKKVHAWRNVTTSAERDNIFKTYGVRWSEFWRLPYWDPTQMLVVDTMHCILLGLIHYHFRYVLGIDWNMAQDQDAPPSAFDYAWVAYHLNVPKKFHLQKDHKEKHVTDIQNILTLPLKGKCSIDEMMLRKRLKSKNLSPLMFVSYMLGLTMHTISVNGQLKLVPAQGKQQFIDLLVHWQMKKPLSANYKHAVIDITALHHIQSVIKATVTPSWIGMVLFNYSEALAGSIKANE
ncbi:hypothetical protein IW262DRAFT_1461979 [Armillaria fumosa]|nr:hypothetical protein IW262DRAFT_1461979 [Armillaria fumosa]